MKTYNAPKLIELATRLLSKLDLPEDRAHITAQTLVESDLMGHTTHGLALLQPYLADMEKGGMKLSGDPTVINDSGASVTWDGQYLPGCWLTHRAIDVALERIVDHPVVTVAIGQSHHIGCLAAYPERATDKGLIMLLSCSDPRNKAVAPYGGLSGVYSPNPIAMGYPTESDPVILDISMSTTAVGLINQSHVQNEKLSHPWLLDSKGKITDDPSTFFSDSPSTILPLGGLDAGYTGFALGMLVEMLTSGLAGNGRADHPTNWGASVFLQIIDPEKFGGAEAFKKQAQFLANACLDSTPSDPNQPVRLPGQRALQLREKQKREGVALEPHIVRLLQNWSDKLGVDFSIIE